MKKVILFSLFILGLTMNTELKGEIKNIVESGKFTIEIERVIPSSMRAQSVTSEYTLTLENGTLSTHLPYIGKVDSAPYSASNSLSIIIEGQKVELTQTYNEKKEKYTITFKAKNDQTNETCKFSIDIFKNGNCNIDLNVLGRQYISYSGKIKQ